MLRKGQRRVTLCFMSDSWPILLFVVVKPQSSFHKPSQYGNFTPLHLRLSHISLPECRSLELHSQTALQHSPQ